MAAGVLRLEEKTGCHPQNTSGPDIDDTSMTEDDDAATRRARSPFGQALVYSRAQGDDARVCLIGGDPLSKFFMVPSALFFDRQIVTRIGIDLAEPFIDLQFETGSSQGRTSGLSRTPRGARYDPIDRLADEPARHSLRLRETSTREPRISRRPIVAHDVFGFCMSNEYEFHGVQP